MGSGADLETRVRFPSLYGEPKPQPLVPAGRMLKPIAGAGARSAAAALPKLQPFYVCADTLPLLNQLDISSPVKNGVVENWVRVTHPVCDEPQLLTVWST